MRPAIHHLRNMLILVPALFACSAMIHQLTPAPFVRSLTPKLTHLEENPDTYDILFVGSSRVFRQISPKIFDQPSADPRLQPAFVQSSAFRPRSRSRSGTCCAVSPPIRGIRPKYVLIEPDGLLIGIERENARHRKGDLLARFRRDHPGDRSLGRLEYRARHDNDGSAYRSLPPRSTRRGSSSTSRFAIRDSTKLRNRLTRKVSDPMAMASCRS